MAPAPTVQEIVQKADADGLMEPALKRLPKNVTSALRAMAAGERPAVTLSPRELIKLGKTIAKWDMPYGRSTLGAGTSSMMAAAMRQAAGIEQPPPKKLPKVSESLIKHLGLASDKATRVEAIAHWPIGFTRADMVQWGMLSEEESEEVLDHIVREYGLYTTGTLYAAP
ncbi:MAG: hypothetical protein AB8I69_10290 [Anaerolineae bacterium]|jgi:hypothetical protein